MKKVVAVSTILLPALLLLASCAGETSNAIERTGVITLEGRSLTLLGPELKVGQKAPDFGLIAPVDYVESVPGAGEVTLADSRGKVTVINVVPSLDTPVCDFSTQKFEDEAGKYQQAVFYAISMDLPFAQARYCGAKNIDTLTTLSDYRDASFGLSYGALIKELRLLTRAIFIIDEDGIVQYVQYVKEISEHPDYDAALLALSGMLGGVAHQLEDTSPGTDINVGNEVGDVAPDFQLESLQGELISLSELRGKPVLLNFWATWCPHCQAERPWIEEISETWPSKGVVIWTINLIGTGPGELGTQETPANLREYMQTNGYSYPVLLDSNQELVKSYGLKATPTNVFIDKNGIIQQVQVGNFDSLAEFEESLSNLMP